MSASSRFPLALALGVALNLAGCGKSHPPDDEHDHAAGTDASARFDAEHGLALASETAAAIGLTAAPVQTRPLAARSEVTATVFDAGPPARASALVPVAIAETFSRDPRILATHRDTLTALGQVELVIAVPGVPPAGTTLAAELRTAPREMLCVPDSAVLRTATGAFVYVRRGEHWSRTAVVIGPNADGFTAITAGLSASDTIATSAVEHLWLTELRLTKGGGHSH